MIMARIDDIYNQLRSATKSLYNIQDISDTNKNDLSTTTTLLDLYYQKIMKLYRR